MLLIRVLMFSFIFVITTSAQNILYKGPIIDMHCHISLLEDSFSMQGRDTKKETIDKIYKDGRFEKVGLIYMARKADNERVSIKNDSLIEICRQNKKYYPICSVHPDHGETALAEIERIYKKGVRFLKFHEMSQNIDYASPGMSNVVKKASELGMAMLFDGRNPMDPTLIGKVFNLANNNPKGKFIIAHMGGDNFKEIYYISLFSMFDWFHNNIYVDISSISMQYAGSPYVEEIKWTIRKIGADKVFFGSDYPAVTPDNSVKDVESFGFTDKEMEAIMYGNAKKLLSSVGIE